MKILRFQKKIRRRHKIIKKILMALWVNGAIECSRLKHCSSHQVQLQLGVVPEKMLNNLMQNADKILLFSDNSDVRYTYVWCNYQLINTCSLMFP